MSDRAMHNAGLLTGQKRHTLLSEHENRHGYMPKCLTQAVVKLHKGSHDHLWHSTDVSEGAML